MTVKLLSEQHLEGGYTSNLMHPVMLETASPGSQVELSSDTVTRTMLSAIAHFYSLYKVYRRIRKSL